MAKKDPFYNKLTKLRSAVKARRQKELYDMIESKNNELEDKIALLKLSFKELNKDDLLNNLSDMIKKDKK